MHVYLISGDSDAGQHTVASRLVGQQNAFHIGTVAAARGHDTDYRVEKMITFLQRLGSQIAGPVAVAVEGVETVRELELLKKAFPTAPHFHVRDAFCEGDGMRASRADFVITWRKPA